MATVTQSLKRGYRTLRLPISEVDYERLMTDQTCAQAQLAKRYAQHPELFPAEFERGDALDGFTEPSCKQPLRCRRLRLNADETVWTVAPGLVMPYRSGCVAEVEKALFLMRFQVPCWALA